MQNLAGPDPTSHRPNWIHVKSIHGKSLDPAVVSIPIPTALRPLLRYNHLTIFFFIKL